MKSMTVFLLVWLSIMTACASRGQRETYRWVTQEGGLELRYKPSLDARVVGTIGYAMRLRIVGRGAAIVRANKADRFLNVLNVEDATIQGWVLESATSSEPASISIAGCTLQVLAERVFRAAGQSLSLSLRSPAHEFLGTLVLGNDNTFFLRTERYHGTLLQQQWGEASFVASGLTDVDDRLYWTCRVARELFVRALRANEDTITATCQVRPATIDEKRMPLELRP